MLKKRNRVGRKEIEKVFKEGRYITLPSLTLKFILNKSRPTKTLSFVVPKTVSKKSVDRNVLRRRGYAALDKYFDKIPAGISGVFIFGRESLKNFNGKKNKNYNPFKNLENAIEKIVNRLN